MYIYNLLYISYFPIKYPMVVSTSIHMLCIIAHLDMEGTQVGTIVPASHMTISTTFDSRIWFQSQYLALPFWHPLLSFFVCIFFN